MNNSRFMSHLTRQWASGKSIVAPKAVKRRCFGDKLIGISASLSLCAASARRRHCVGNVWLHNRDIRADIVIQGTRLPQGVVIGRHTFADVRGYLGRWLLSVSLVSLVSRCCCCLLPLAATPAATQSPHGASARGSTEKARLRLMCVGIEGAVVVVGTSLAQRRG